MSNGAAGDHEYHEISDEDGHFDFGPSLLDEVFGALDMINPSLSHEIREQQQSASITESNTNVKNELMEMASKLAIGNKDGSKKKQATVKPMSAADQQSLDSAIAMAKELASRSMLDQDCRMTAADNNGTGSADSPKTPNSPNKKTTKFHFPKFGKLTGNKSSERRILSEECAEKFAAIESIITEEAKEAYNSLVARRSADKNSKNNNEHAAAANGASDHSNGTTNATTNSKQETAADNGGGSPDDAEANPFRMLKNGIVTKVRGNKQRFSTGPQTASLARMASLTRTTLGPPPPVPVSAPPPELNALPLPPRPVKPVQPMQALKHHQRKHPLLLPGATTAANGSSTPNGSSESLTTTTSAAAATATTNSQYMTISTATSAATTTASNKNGNTESPYVPVLSTFRPHLPAVGRGLNLKQVSCPEPPAGYLSGLSSKVSTTSENGHSSSTATTATTAGTGGNPSPFPFTISKPIPIQLKPPPAKPARTFQHQAEKSSFETQIQTAIDKLDRITQSLGRIERVASVATQSPNASSENLMESSKPSLEETRKDKALPQRKHSLDSDEVRIMQKVLANEVTLRPEECAEFLDGCGDDVHKAIKCIRLRETLRAHGMPLDCNWIEMLSRFNWNIRQASNYLLATQGGEDTEV